MTQPRKNPVANRVRTRDLPLSRRRLSRGRRLPTRPRRRCQASRTVRKAPPPPSPSPVVAMTDGSSIDNKQDATYTCCCGPNVADTVPSHVVPLPLHWRPLTPISHKDRSFLAVFTVHPPRHCRVEASHTRRFRQTEGEGFLLLLLFCLFVYCPREEARIILLFFVGWDGNHGGRPWRDAPSTRSFHSTTR